MRKDHTALFWLSIVGIVPLLGAGAFVARMTWEQTALTASEGPQNVGFSLMHTAGGLVILLLGCVAVLHVWWLAMLAAVAFSTVRKRSVYKPAVWMLVAGIVVIAPAYVPYGWWRFAIFKTVGPSEHADSHMNYAAAMGETYNVRELLRQGVPVDVADSLGTTALSAAAVEGHLEVARLLIEHGASMNERSQPLGRTPLMNAAESGQPEMIRYLLSAGADASIADDRGETALAIASRRGDVACASLLEVADKR
jgi:hypothetical protein